MAKLPRIIHNLFGQNANTGEIGVFGSFAAGTPTTATDPTIMQSLSNWLSGWKAAVIGGNAPCIEDMNAAFFVHSYQQAYMFQAGIPEWQTAAVYYKGSLVNLAGVIYVSMTDNNTGNALTDPTNWQVRGSAIRTVTGTDTATVADDVLLCDATSASFAETFPPAASMKSRTLRVIVVNTNGNTVTPTGNGSELVGLNNTYRPLGAGESADFFSTGVQWYAV